jgi:glycosyltransferase involved in cell wall biosynthesis
MNILLVNYEYKPQGGGAGVGTYNMAKAFSEMGNKVTLLIGWDNRFGKPDIPPNVDVELIQLKKKHLLRSSVFQLLLFVLRGLPIIRKLTKNNRYDIIQLYFSVPTGFLKYGIYEDVPYVVSLRGVDTPKLQNNQYGLLSSIVSPFNKAITKNAAAVLSLSNEAARMYKQFAPSTDITVIPNAVDFGSYIPKTKYSKKIKRFVSVSRLITWKNHDLLIDCIATLHECFPEISLDIYGDGYLSKYLEKQIEDRSASNYIKLKGYATPEKLAVILSDYDIFALLSTGDSFGLVFIEAMSCGLPIVCARAGGPIDVVLEGKTGFFSNPGDKEDTISVLRYCIEHPEEMEILGRAGRLRVEELYSVESIAKQHISLYKKILMKKEDNLKWATAR